MSYKANAKSAYWSQFKVTKAAKFVEAADLLQYWTETFRNFVIDLEIISYPIVLFPILWI